MKNAQKWLDEKYPNKEKVTHIIAKNENLEGNLIIKDFSNLEEIKCGSNKNLTSIELNNLPQLNHFHANNCQLTSLEINDCPNISYLNVGNNLLKETSFLNKFNPEKLCVLSIHTNNFKKQGLGIFSKLANLKELYLDNCDRKKFRKHIYNRFMGSLKPLQNLTKLELLSIGNTDISGGLEYLPKSLRKIGFNVAWQTKTDCTKVRKELKEASQISGVTEKLQQPEGNDPEWINSYYRIAPWRQAQTLLSEEEQKKRVAQQRMQQWLNEKYPKNTTFLTIDGRNLEGCLDLREFTELEKLDCSVNKLTSLDLSNCVKLTHLYCDNNSFTDLDFLDPENEKGLPHPEKLKDLYIGNNENLSQQSLSFLVPFIGVEELNIENCPFEGSLEYLREMNNLQHLSLSGTDIDSGLSDLPASCQSVYCNFDYQTNKKSINIIKELSKYSGEEGYDLAKWREEKQSDITAKVLPLDRLFVIRSNLKQFVNRWGKKDEGELNNELSKLQSPEQYSKFRYLGGVKWIARATAATGGILALTDNATIGGSLAAASPFVDAIATHVEENYYQKREEKWKDFLKDADMFLDNYHELLGIIKGIKAGELGEVNQSFKNLKEKVDALLNEYDQPDENGEKNGEIDLEELIAKRKDLANDLDNKRNSEEKSRVWEIIDTMKELENKIIAYRQGVNIEGKSAQIGLEESQEVTLEQQQEIAHDEGKIINNSNQVKNQPETIIDLDEHLESNQSLNSSQTNLLDKSQKEAVEMQNLEGKQTAQIQQTNLPYGTPGSSK